MKYTADEVDTMAGKATQSGHLVTADMLRELSAILRAQEQEAKRDVVKYPKAGDRVEYPASLPAVYGRNSIQVIYPEDWEIHCLREGATIIPRREVKP